MHVITENEAVSNTNERPTIAMNAAGLDLQTIRERVATIKGEWTAETRHARAIEGRRRRRELESLLLDFMTDVSDSEESCDIQQHGFSLVG